MIAVDRTEVVDEDGMAVPDSEQGTTTVVRTWMVVTGPEGVAVADGDTGAAQVTIAGLAST